MVKEKLTATLKVRLTPTELNRLCSEAAARKIRISVLARERLLKEFVAQSSEVSVVQNEIKAPKKDFVVQKQSATPKQIKSKKPFVCRLKGI